MERLQVPFELKQVSEDDKRFFIFEGLASTFGNTDLVDDIVEKGAFLDSLAVRMPKVLWQHDTNEPIGMPESLFETEQGLLIKGKLPKNDTFVSGRVIPQMMIGSISSMSIGFTVKDFEIRDGIRHLKEIDLFEISLVTFPANPAATVNNFKSITHDKLSRITTRKEYNELLKQTGCFSKQAREFLAAQFNPGLCNTGVVDLGNLGLTESIKSLTKDLRG